MVFGFQSSNPQTRMALFQISFNPAIPKDNTKVFEVTFDFPGAAMSLPDDLPSTEVLSARSCTRTRWWRPPDRLRDGARRSMTAAPACWCKRWACWADGTGTYSSPGSGIPNATVQRPGIQELSFAFDRNMQVSVSLHAGRRGQTALVRFIRAGLRDHRTSPVSATPSSPIDDKRETASSRSDVIFAYLTGTRPQSGASSATDISLSTTGRTESSQPAPQAHRDE